MKTKHVFILLSWLWSVGLFAQVATPIISGEKPPASLHSRFPDQSIEKFSEPPDAPGSITMTALPSNGSNSYFSRAPSNYYNYQRTEYLITPTEMASSGFPSGAEINSIWFYIYIAGSGTLTGTLNIYLKNTSDATYSLGTGWTTAGFTQVCAKTNWTAPISGSWYEISFTGGSPFAYTGGGVYVAWEYSAAGTPGASAVWHYTNTTLTNGIYCARSNTSLPSTLSPENYRPATAFTNSSLIDIIGVSHIYTLEKVPVPNGCPVPLTVRVINYSSSAQTFNLTVTIKDPTNSIVRFTSTLSIQSLPGNSSGIVSFSGWNPSISENVTITASTSVIPGESYTANNSLTISSNVNTNIFSYNYNFPAQYGYGITYPSSGIYAAKYTMNGTGQITGINIGIANVSVNVGNIIYAVLLNASGTIVSQTAYYTITTTDLGSWKSFSLPAPVSFTNETFYAGMAQIGGSAQWFPLAAVSENPVRANTFYKFGLTGGTPTVLSDNLKLGLEAQVGTIPVSIHDVGIYSLDAVQVFPTDTSYSKSYVKNYGNVTETFTVNMTIGAYSSTKTVTALAPDATALVTFDAWIPAIGDYTMTVCTQLTGDQNTANNCSSQNVKVLPLNKTVYGYILNPGTSGDPAGPINFNLKNPGLLNSIANQTAQTPLNGGTWLNGIWYATVNSTALPYNLITLNNSTGARSTVGNMGVKMNGISYNTANGILYGINGTSLYSINTSSGAATLIGSNTGTNLAGLAINSTGQCFAVDITADVLGAVNLTTGTFTSIGAIGFNATTDMDMEFDRDNGNLFMAAYKTQGELRWVNTATGSTMLVGPFEGGAQVTGMAIPYIASVPTLTTTQVSGITTTTATSGGNISGDGGVPVFERGVCWSGLPNPTISDPHTLSGSGTGTFTANITGLAPCSTYYLRAYATNSAGTAYGAQVIFSTFCIKTAAITNITINSATSGGNITHGGSSPVTVRGVCWSTSGNPTTANSKTTNGSGTGAFTSSLTGLTAVTIYHVRAYATNTEGTFYGADSVFQTKANLPVVTTNAIANVTTSAASSGGNVASNGGATVTARGVCWNTTGNPTIADPHSSDGTGNGAYVSAITGLAEYTIYYVRAYATNSGGTGYGASLQLRTLPSACGTDVVYDGKTYQTIQIGEQCWMKQNLNVGSVIQGTISQTNNTIVEKYCFNNLASNCDIYGGLYQWGEAVQYLNGASNTANWNPALTGTVQGICPAQWHLPSDGEWSELSTFLGGTTFAGGKLKETGTIHWVSPNTSATNSTGFTGMPGGFRYSEGSMFDYGYYGYFWGATPNDNQEAWSYILSFTNAKLERYNGVKTYGFSVRCIKNNLPPPVDLTISSDTLFSPNSHCYNALQTIIVSGSENAFLVQNGGSATFIAGEKIRFLTGTRVLNGGYLRGYIANNGQFCSTTSPAKISETTIQDENTGTNNLSPLIRIYPNPTSGIFTIEIDEPFKFDWAQVDIYGLRGEQIISEKMVGVRKHLFSLEGVVKGVYFVRVATGERVETRLIIKQ